MARSGVGNRQRGIKEPEEWAEGTQGRQEHLPLFQRTQIQLPAPVLAVLSQMLAWHLSPGLKAPPETSILSVIRIDLPKPQHSSHSRAGKGLGYTRSLKSVSSPQHPSKPGTGTHVRTDMLPVRSQRSRTKLNMGAQVCHSSTWPLPAPQ